MNITLAHLVVARALSGPYLSMTPMTGHRSLMVDSGRFSHFFSNFLRSTAAMHMEVTRSDFRHFQDSAFFLSRAEPELVDKVFNDQQVISGTDGENATFTSCTFYGCHARDTGGAISSTDGVAIVVEGCGFLKCTAENNGGALFLVNETNLKDGWFGSWDGLFGAPCIVVNRSCFSECYVNGESEVPDEVNKTGYVLYARAIQVFMDDFSAIDCSRKGARRAAVFYGWINDMVTRGGNLTIDNSVKPDDLSPFNVQFGGYYNGQSLFGKPFGVDHSYHCVTGFTCQWVYRINLEDILSACSLTNITVIGTELLASETDQSAIFFIDFWRKKENDDGKNIGKKVTLSDCCAFMDTTFQPTSNQYFYYHVNENDGKNVIPITKTSCKTNVDGWAKDGIEKADPTVVELDLENGAHCDYEPPDPSSFESDLESEMSETEQGGGGGGDGSTDGSLGPGEIAGIIIAILVIIAIIIIIVICMRRRRDFTTESTGDKEQEKPDENSETTTTISSVANDPLVSANYAGTQLNQIFEDADTLTMRSFEEDEDNP